MRYRKIKRYLVLYKISTGALATVIPFHSAVLQAGLIPDIWVRCVYINANAISPAVEIGFP